jgi:hypothetical protein
MRTPQTPNFSRSHITHSYEHPHLHELCAQTHTNTHFVRIIREKNHQKTLKNELFHKNTQNRSYISYKHLNLLLQIPTVVQKLHFGLHMCHPWIAFSQKIFIGNTQYGSKYAIIYLITPKRSILTSQ